MGYVVAMYLAVLETILVSIWNTYFGAKHRDIVFGEEDQEWCRDVHITTDPDGQSGSLRL